MPAVGQSMAIDHDEARHAFGARRLDVGDTVTLFDGAGNLAIARLGERGARGSDVLVEVLEAWQAPPLAPEVTIAFAIPKGDRLSTLLDGATQAGVSRLVPIVCARSVIDADKLDRSERWQRIMSEAAKVAKRAWMPHLIAGGELLAVAKAECARGSALAIAHTNASDTDRVSLRAWSDGLPAAQPRTIFIGPQGGFDESELEAMRELAATRVSLGPFVMRIELAAVAATVLLRA